MIPELRTIGYCWASLVSGKVLYEIRQVLYTVVGDGFLGRERFEIQNGQNGRVERIGAPADKGSGTRLEERPHRTQRHRPVAGAPLARSHARQELGLSRTAIAHPRWLHAAQ